MHIFTYIILWKCGNRSCLYILDIIVITSHHSRTHSFVHINMIKDKNNKHFPLVAGGGAVVISYIRIKNGFWFYCMRRSCLRVFNHKIMMTLCNERTNLSFSIYMYSLSRSHACANFFRLFYLITIHFFFY